MQLSHSEELGPSRCSIVEVEVLNRLSMADHSVLSPICARPAVRGFGLEEARHLKRHPSSSVLLLLRDYTRSQRSPVRLLNSRRVFRACRFVERTSPRKPTSPIEHSQSEGLW